MKLNGQMMSTILEKTSVERREEMVILIRAAFLELQTIDLGGVQLSILLEYLAILNELQVIFQDVSATSTYDIARVCCRSLKLSKWRIVLSCEIHYRQNPKISALQPSIFVHCSNQSDK